MILRLMPLVKASYKRNKARSVVFFLFMLFCVICILLTVSVILPMWGNMETKINNHPYNVELSALLTLHDDETPAKLERIEHVERVYYSPFAIDVTDVDNVVGGYTRINYLHNDYMPEITAGRAIKAGEKNAAVMPETIKIRNPETQRMTELDCKKLVGKEIRLKDMSGNDYKIKIVGTYSLTDPALYGDDICTTYEQMLEYDKKIPHEDDNGKRYSVIVDHKSNRDAVEKQCNEIVTTYFENSFKIDADSFNIAIIVLLCVLAAFLVMVVIGTSVFVASCIGARTNELALYRSLGYKSRHIFTIIFTEYFVEFLFAIAAAVIISLAAARLIIDPYLDSLLGGSIMAMNAEIGIVNVLLVFIAFLIIILCVCIRATRRTGKIELSVLLKER